MAILSFTTKEPTVVDLLRTDHEKVKALFRDFEAAEDTGRRQSIVQQAISELEIHTTVEEAVFYPALRQDSPDAAQQLDESLEEHHVVRLLMRELKRMSPNDERFDAKFRVLVENIKHHIKEEEAELFARARTGNLDLTQLAKRLEAAKASFRPPGDEPKTRTAKRPAASRKGRTTRQAGGKQTGRKAGKRTVA